MHRLFRFMVVALALGLGGVARAQVGDAIRAHGGWDRWAEAKGLEYRLEMRLGPMQLTDTQQFDLVTRQGRIDGPEYQIGVDGPDVWVMPGPGALPMPPRFYVWTPFYFFAIPFVLADRGTVHSPLGRKPFEGKLYDAVKVTYAPGSGDAPEDYYTLYIDPDTGLVRLVVYIVTYPALRQGKPLSQIAPSALIYDSWQEVDGLKVPETGRFVAWLDNGARVEPKGTIRFDRVRFSPTPPSPDRFRKPAEATIDRSHLPSAR